MGVSHLPTSKAGDAMGDSSVVMVKMPSNLRSGRGRATSADMRVRTLVALGFGWHGRRRRGRVGMMITWSSLAGHLRRRTRRRKSR